MKGNFFLIILIFIVFGLIIFFPFGASIGKNAFLGSSAENNSLVLENESLKTELAKLKNVAAALPQPETDYVPAFVYSTYPFNFKNEILVEAGKNDGVNVGSPVVLKISATSTPVLVGKIEKVFSGYSVAQTVFDGLFQLSVRVGDNGVDSLLRGGANPVLTLIPMDASISNGDAVYSVSKDFPYGLAVGLAENITSSTGQLFEQADLEAGYNPNDLKSVLILKNYARQ